MRLHVDFTQVTGRVKAMHGVGQPPLVGLNDCMYHYLTEAGIPFSRLHDVGVTILSASCTWPISRTGR